MTDPFWLACQKTVLSDGLTHRWFRLFLMRTESAKWLFSSRKAVAHRGVEKISEMMRGRSAVSDLTLYAVCEDISAESGMRSMVDMSVRAERLRVLMMLFSTLGFLPLVIHSFRGCWAFVFCFAVYLVLNFLIAVPYEFFSAYFYRQEKNT